MGVGVRCQLFLKGLEEDKEKRRKRIKRKGGGADVRKGGDTWGDNSKSGESRRTKKTH